MAKTPAEDSSKKANDEEINSKEQELLDKISELTEALQRERADSMNLRRRHEEELSRLRSVTKAGVINSLLPVIDNFERSLKHIPEDLKDHSYIKGIEGVVKQFEKTLADIGVEKIATVDEPFDPRFHEAVSMDDEGGSKEVVSEELQSGYKIGDDVVRHAFVKVKLVN